MRSRKPGPGSWVGNDWGGGLLGAEVGDIATKCKGSPRHSLSRGETFPKACALDWLKDGLTGDIRLLGKGGREL